MRFVIFFGKRLRKLPKIVPSMNAQFLFNQAHIQWVIFTKFLIIRSKIYVDFISDLFLNQ